MDGKDVEMNDKGFEALKLSITQKMLELSCLQELYAKETGRCYIPGIELKRSIDG